MIHTEFDTFVEIVSPQDPFNSDPGSARKKMDPDPGPGHEYF